MFLKLVSDIVDCIDKIHVRLVVTSVDVISSKQFLQHKIADSLTYSEGCLKFKLCSLGHVKNIPTIQYFTGISRNTQNKILYVIID